MPVRLKKVLRGFLILILSIVLLVTLAVGIAINFIFTPEKLTPQATEIANEYIDAKLEMGGIELTFFSTFPDLEVEINYGLLVTNMGDSLLAFEKLGILMDPVAILSDKIIHIDSVSITNPIIYTELDTLGNINWNIVKEQTSKVQSDAVKIKEDGVNEDTYIVDNIEIQNAEIKFLDQANSFYAGVQNMDILGEIYYTNDQLDCNLDLKVDTMSLTLNDEPIINPLSLKLHSRSNIDLAEYQILIDTINLKVIDHEIEVESKGSIKIDSAGAIAIDLNNRIFTSNIREALDLIPIRYVNVEKIDGRGEVNLVSSLKGVYSQSQFPVVELNLEITNGQAAYKGFDKELELFETKLTSRIDYLNKRSSVVNLKSLNVKSDGFSVNLKGIGSQILTNPHLVFSGNGRIKFEDLLKTFPIDDLKAKGRLDFNVSSDFYLEDLVNYHYEKIGLNGNATLKSIDLNYLGDSIKFATSQSKMNFKQDLNATSNDGSVGTRLLNGKIVFSDLQMHVRDLTDVETKRFALTIKTTPSSDSSTISPTRVTINTNYAQGVFGDTLTIMGRRVKGYIFLKPAIRDPKIPVYISKLEGDVFKVNDEENRLRLTEFDWKIQIVEKENRWPLTASSFEEMKGEIYFDNLNFFTTLFPKGVDIKQTSFSITSNRLSLNNALVKTGTSDLILSGNIFNLQKNLKGESSLKADLDIKSEFLNINEITSILDKSSKYDSNQDENEVNLIAHSDGDVEQDETISQLETIVVPKNVNFKLNLNLDSVSYSDLILEEVTGNMLIRNQILRLNDFKTRTKAADLDATAVYLARSKGGAKAYFNIKLTDVDIENMMQILPFLDTLLPMTKDFEGKVNLGMRGSAKLDEHMGIKTSTLESVARLEGQDLILLDGETFRYLAKTLKFKNRDKHTLDTLAVEMAIENGALEIFPSLVTMDRYKVAIGGTQNLDLSFAYHISVLKSPLPFKTGIDIYGEVDDYDYKLTKAKYKYIFSGKEKDQDKVDPELTRKRQEILEKIKFDN